MKSRPPFRNVFILLAALMSLSFIAAGTAPTTASTYKKVQGTWAFGSKKKCEYVQNDQLIFKKENFTFKTKEKEFLFKIKSYLLFANGDDLNFFIGSIVGENYLQHRFIYLDNNTIQYKDVSIRKNNDPNRERIKKFDEYLFYRCQ